VRFEQKRGFRKRLALDLAFHRIMRDDPPVENVIYLLYNAIIFIIKIQKGDHLSLLSISLCLNCRQYSQQSDQQSFHAGHTKDQSLMMIDGEEKLSRHNGVSHIESARSGTTITAGTAR